MNMRKGSAFIAALYIMASMIIALSTVWHIIVANMKVWHTRVVHMQDNAALKHVTEYMVQRVILSYEDVVQRLENTPHIIFDIQSIPLSHTRIGSIHGEITKKEGINITSVLEVEQRTRTIHGTLKRIDDGNGHISYETVWHAHNQY